MWVARSKDEVDGALQAEMIRLNEELEEIVALGTAGTCRLCGKSAVLTEEHAPSRKAGNVGPLIRSVIDEGRTSASGTVAWQADRIQGGVTALSLCGACNNTTGSWYNPAYVKLVRAATPLAKVERAATVCSFDVVLHRQRVVKQALVTVLATCQPGLTERYPELRELLLDNKTSRAITPLGSRCICLSAHSPTRLD